MPQLELDLLHPGDRDRAGLEEGAPSRFGRAVGTVGTTAETEVHPRDVDAGMRRERIEVLSVRSRYLPIVHAIRSDGAVRPRADPSFEVFTQDIALPAIDRADVRAYVAAVGERRRVDRQLEVVAERLSG